MTVLVTGVAGFIGAALAQKLLERGDQIIGIDNLNDYYDVRLKKARTSRISSCRRLRIYKSVTNWSVDRRVDRLFRTAAGVLSAYLLGCDGRNNLFTGAALAGTGAEGPPVAGGGVFGCADIFYRAGTRVIGGLGGGQRSGSALQPDSAG